MHDSNCIFCKIITGQIPSKIILETQFSIVIQDIAPQAPIHYLILPKKHIKDLASCADADRDIVADMMLVPSFLAQGFDQELAFKLVTNNGYAAGQRVFHLHFHFMAGKNFDV
mgnify:CR=1 FL=1